MRYNDKNILSKNICLNTEEIANKIAAFAESTDAGGGFPKNSIQLLRDNGYMGMLIPKAYGGLGCNYDSFSKVAQILSNACLSTGMIWAMHCQQVEIITRYGAESLKSRILPKIARGEMYVVSVTSDYQKKEKPSILLETSTGAYIERYAPTVTGGAFGEGFMITIPVELNSNKTMIVFAERSQLEIQVGSLWKNHSMGMRGTESVSLELKGMIPEDQLISWEKYDSINAQTIVPSGHIAWSSCWLGAAKGALQRAIGILRNPKTRNEFDFQSDLFKEKIARIRLQIDVVDVLVQQAFKEYDEHIINESIEIYTSIPYKIRMNNLKIMASENTFQAVNEVIQLLGLKYGYIKNQEINLERTLRDLRSASLMLNNDRLYLINGRLAIMDKKLLPY